MTSRRFAQATHRPAGRPTRGRASRAGLPWLAAGLALAVAGPSAGCGREIGDSCLIAADCGTDLNVICDVASIDGYCTIPGCDYGTCPDEAVCVRFFTASFQDLPCNQATEDLDGEGSTNDCGLDEACTLTGQCVPASAEVRFCMKTCEVPGDCRDGYECRNLELMQAHGGEPVPPPGERLESFPSFCAQAPPS